MGRISDIVEKWNAVGEEAARERRERLGIAEHSTQPTPPELIPPPMQLDPEGAIEDMRLAHSYLEDWIEKKGDHVLGLAAQYIELARAKDPNASLSVEIKKRKNKKEILTYTQDELAGMTLFYQSQIHSYPDAPKVELERARDLLKRALAYVPISVQYRCHLADVYLNLHDKPSALAIAQEALSTNPKDLEARKLLVRSKERVV